MLRVGSIVIRVDDLQRQTAFWSAALDYEARPGADDFVLRPKDGVGPNVSLDAVPAKVQVPPRIHLDLYAEDQAGEVQRLIALGATEIHWSKRPPDADYVILADPEGNRLLRVVDILGRGRVRRGRLLPSAAWFIRSTRSSTARNAWLFQAEVRCGSTPTLGTMTREHHDVEVGAF